MSNVDLDRLDDLEGLAKTDPQDMLRAVATSAAQVRSAVQATVDADLRPLDLDARPRAVVVTGMGGSAISGDVLSAVAGLGAPVPIVVHRGYGLPAWVGAADLVIAVSCSGATAETLSATSEATRRGTRLLAVSSADSALQAEALSRGGAFIPVTKVLSPRSSLWAMVVPLLMVGARMRLLDLGTDDAHLEAAAVQLESTAQLCGPDRESYVNPAKMLAAELANTLPMIWGSGPLGPVAALRAASQIAENAKLPAVFGALPEANHQQVVTFDGPLAGRHADEDLFRDRVDEDEPLRLRLLIVRDDTDEVAAHRADASANVAAGRGVAVSVLTAQGTSAVERLASMIGVVDYASVYLGLANGIDPTPIAPIDDLKRAMAASPYA